MLKCLLFSTAIAGLFLVASPDEASAQCDSDSDVLSDCWDNFTNAARDTFGAESDAEKAQTVREAVEECLNCAADHLSDQLDRFGEEDE